MSAASARLLLCGLVLLLTTGLSTACDCVGCTSTFSLAAGSTEDFTPTASCAAGQQVVVNSLNIQSTDGSGFDVTTRDSASSSDYYSTLSASDVSCFDMGAQPNELSSNTAVVQVQCDNTFEHCPLQYNIGFSCVGGSSGGGGGGGGGGGFDSSTAGGGAGGGNAPTPPSGESYCTCDCCEGADCSPSIVGYVPNSGCASDCPTMCRSTFSNQCPAAGQNGVMGSSCTASSGGGGGGGGGQSSAGGGGGGGQSSAGGGGGGGGSTPTPPSGESYCTCDCCESAFCSPSIVGYVENSGCASDCPTMCRSIFSNQCPAAGQNGVTGSSCTAYNKHTNSAAEQHAASTALALLFTSASLVSAYCF